MKIKVKILDTSPLFSALSKEKDVYKIKGDILFDCKAQSKDGIKEIFYKNETEPKKAPENAEIEFFSGVECEKELYNRIKTLFCGEEDEKNLKSIGEVVDELPNYYKNYVNSANNESVKAERIGAVLLISSLFDIENGEKLSDIERTENGKPYFSQKSEVFNISHSENLVCLACFDDKWGNEPTKEANLLGVDIEKVCDLSSEETEKRKKIANRFFSKEENEWLARLDKKDFAYAFTLLWTKKESEIKMTGDGFSFCKNEKPKAKQKSYHIKNQGESYILSLSYIENA